MSNVKVYTNDGAKRNITSVAGTKVFVGDTAIDMVLDLKLVAEPSGIWQLQITVAVDPATLFAVLPKEA